MANRISHRYNHLPLLLFRPGGVRQELVVPICHFKINHIEPIFKAIPPCFKSVLSEIESNKPTELQVVNFKSDI